MKIYNMTSHPISAEQVKAGVVYIPDDLQPLLNKALNFEGVPTGPEVHEACLELASIMAQLDPDLTDECQFMMGGAGYLMMAMGQFAPSYRMVFAASNKVSSETTLPSGVVVKKSEFLHLGFTPGI